jgi:type IV pilus assembly protein PilP
MKRAYLLALLLLMGCGGDEFADLKTFMAQAGGNQPPLEALPPVKAPDNFTYEPGSLPDPFKVRNLKFSKGGPRPEENRPRGELEEFPIDALRMVGTMQKGGQLTALIRTPKGEVRMIRKGEYIGQNNGVVTAIRETGIDIREIVQDGAGDWVEGKAVLPLQE